MSFNVRSRRCPVSRTLTPAGAARWFLVLVAACLVAVPAQAQAYDAAADFSATDNPNGAWSYGWSPTLGGVLNLYVHHDNVAGVDFWRDQTDPNVSHNSSGSRIRIGTVTWPPGQLAFHPGPFGEYAVIRWTAPADGFIAILAGFVGLDFVGPTTTDVHVLYNDASIFDGEVTGFGEGSGPSFRTIVYVSAGDTIDFAVGDGDDGTYNYDSTGIDAIITYLFGR
jgi:hypothetical protein